MSARPTGPFAYWGKAEPEGDDTRCHLLVYHSLDVAAVGRDLLFRQNRLLADLAGLFEVREEDVLEWLSFWLALHDIGKFSDGFQNLRPDLLSKLQGRETGAEYVERHDSLGYRLSCGQAREKGLVVSWLADTTRFPNLVRELTQPIASSVMGHHGKPPLLTSAPVPLARQFPPSVWGDIARYLDQVKELFPTGEALPFGDREPGVVLGDLRRISWIVAGITVAADWIGSNDVWFPFVREPMALEKYWRKHAIPQAERAISESGIMAMPASKTTGLQFLYPGIEAPTPLQRQVETIRFDEAPQLFIVEEVTGGGKTEAAITLAHRLMAAGNADGVYIAMPTMATANAMYARIRDVHRKLFEEGSTPQLVLAHSASRMALNLEERNRPAPGPRKGEETASQECSAWLSDSRKKALLAHVGVGTIDQALMGILPVRHQSMRLFGLCRKVLIVDEVHACDDYVHQLLCTLLEFHASLGGSAILLSATLPSRMRAQLAVAFAKGLQCEPPETGNAHYPLVTQVSMEGTASHPVGARQDCSRRVDVVRMHDLQAVEDAIKQRLAAGECVCWVRNTVDDALESYEAWAGRLGVGQVTVFHARFALGDRLRIENNVLGRFGPKSTAEGRRGQLLIATQVVEQSLDLDFDFMVSDLAPVDLIIQRAGRLRRHSRNRAGNRISGEDERGRPVMAVVMPEPVAKPEANWFSSMFPRAQWVYDHHGELWLTARWLSLHGGFSMPEDARLMIEAVFGEGASADIPEGLGRATVRAEGNAGAMTAQARLNGLALDSGYQAATTASHWHDDASAPTRLGEPTVTVRLARWDRGRLVPFAAGDARHAWELSQATVRRHKIAKESPNIRSAALESAKASMPDGGKWSAVVPLSPAGESWTGEAANEAGKVVRLRYNARTGLQFPEGERG